MSERKKLIRSKANKNVTLIKAPCCGKMMPVEAVCEDNIDKEFCSNANPDVVKNYIQKEIKNRK